MRGYLGNSARGRTKTTTRGNQSRPNTNNKKKPRRKRPVQDDVSDPSELDIIPSEELASSKTAMNLTELKKQPAADLVVLADSMGLENLARSRKQDIIFSILKSHAKDGEDIYGDGVLEILQDGFGFLRSADSSYLAGPDDIYVCPSRQVFQSVMAAGIGVSSRPFRGPRMASPRI